MQPQGDLLDMNSWFRGQQPNASVFLTTRGRFRESSSSSEMITQETQDASLFPYITLWDANVSFLSKKTSLLKILQFSVKKYKMSKLYSTDHLNPSHCNKKSFVIFFFFPLSSTSHFISAGSFSA